MIPISYYLRKIALDMSKSQYRINWVKPDLSDEIGEYFENDATKKFLNTKGFSYDTEEELLFELEKGRLVPVAIDQLTKGTNFTLTPEDFHKELSDPEYRKSYMNMKSVLEKNKMMTLPAPILLDINGVPYGFSGNRRINLAMEYGIPLKVWLVDLRK